MYLNTKWKVPTHVLPFTFRHVQEGEDSENSQDAEIVTPQAEQTNQESHHSRLPSESASISETEEADVRWFMERFRVNSGIIELLNQYLIALANRGEKIWYVTNVLIWGNLPQMYTSILCATVKCAVEYY